SLSCWTNLYYLIHDKLQRVKILPILSCNLSNVSLIQYTFVHLKSVKSSPKYRKWHFRDSKFKNFLGPSALAFSPPKRKELPTALLSPLPLLLNAIPHQTFCYQQTIYHCSTLVRLPSLPVNSIVINARRATTRLLTIRVAICASCVIPRTVPSLNGNFAKTVTGSLKVTNASTAIKMTLSSRSSLWQSQMFHLSKAKKTRSTEERNDLLDDDVAVENDSRTKAVTRKSFLGQTRKTSFASGCFSRKTRIRRLSHITFRLTTEIITRGAKILSLTVPEMNIKFIDSLCFIPMKLAAFPKTFGLTELQKGYFPHFFNRAENQDYVGPLPDSKFYDPDGMSSDDREKFYSWYNEQVRRQYEFDFQAEILRYCQSDVDILRRCCLEFRELFSQITDVDPFASCLTIASACNLVFRKTFLQENTIAVIPPCGYKPENKQSVIALKMLAWVAQRDNTVIRHARNHGEQRIGKYFVDGFNVETNTVWEIQGCLWHGCERCYARDTVNPINHMTMQDLKQRTLEKIQFLKDNGHNVVEIWTCDIERQLATEPEMKDFIDNFEISEPLEPRHAFFGGRTNATRLYYDVQPEEKIRYVDFCSLYPWCNKYGEYPIGHPKIITENFQPISDYFGLVKCSVLPPRALYHPVLPYRTQGKLMFPLCRTCADNLQQEPCHHSDAERTLHGTWVTLELEKALGKGYKLMRVDEVWHFPEHTDGLFKDYIDTFLKIKQEASGFPPECDTDEKKGQYIADYAAKEGKFAQRPNMTKLNRRVLYFDTDSVIYVSKEDEWEPPTGSYLGQLTDELDGGYITTFVSGGPKNYAYETSTDKTVCKVRGITLNYRTAQKVNFNLMCDMVCLEALSDLTDSITVNIPYKINRDTKEKSVKTRSENKDYRIVYNKRLFLISRVVFQTYSLEDRFDIRSINKACSTELVVTRRVRKKLKKIGCVVSCGILFHLRSLEHITYQCFNAPSGINQRIDITVRLL
ncbi:DNA polymerase, partial [Paramuricea clavata]